ncbi:MAG TPA: PilZ domain-containing protein [Myxococcales bacterium]|nr:PilZ domain-containing protein [Myxococcales bacterium]
MSKFTVAPGERVLVQGQCLDMNNTLAYKGTLTVTNQRVQFNPTTLNKALGAGSWELAAVQLERVELAGLKKVLTIVAGPNTIRLMGRDVLILFDRLKSLVREIHGGSGDDAAFNSGECILLQGDVALELNKVISTKGHITITNQRIRFQPKKTLESLLWRGTGLDAPLSSVTSVKLAAIRKRIELVVGGKKRAYFGALIPQLYGMLKVLIQDGSDNLLGNWTATLHRGALAQRGELFATTQRLLFYPTGALDAITGASKEISLSVSRIDSMEVTRIEERLVVTAGQVQHQFTVANPGKRVMAMVPSMIYTPSDEEPEVTTEAFTVDLAVATTLLEPWKSSMIDQPGTLKLCGPAVQLQGGRGTRRGLLFLTSDKVIFGPTTHGNLQSNAVVLNLASLVPLGNDEEPENQLRLTADSMTIKLFPRGEVAFTQLFWKLWAVERERIIQEARLRLRERKRKPSGPQDEYNRRQAFRLLFARPKRAYLHIPQLPKMPEPEVAEVSAENAAPVGGLVERVDGVAVTQDQSADASSAEVNRWRSSHFDLSTLPKKMVIGKTINLSDRGAFVASPVELEEKQEFYLQFDRNFLPGRLLAQVIHVKKTGKTEWRAGVEFLDMEAHHVGKIRQIVMEAQREELRERAEMDVD